MFAVNLMNEFRRAASWANAARAKKDHLADTMELFGRIAASGTPGDPCSNEWKWKELSDSIKWRSIYKCGIIQIKKFKTLPTC